ncbi:phosphotransferase family protein [Halomarina pelagica]|uniref:phosphotransferase family protein n=1 Tax=Halomarina pelagica TaxID=2961599 RepID=UPI0020C1ED80|nr:phosphotransferase [Halomarina sp. BND7]
MTSNAADEPICTTTISEMVRTVKPSWSVSDHTPAKGGYLPVHLLTVDTPSGQKRVVLKSSPDEQSHGIDTEARIVRILGANTSIPVSEVYGAVDEHDELPSPFFLMEYVPGTTIERTEMHTVSEGILEHVARESGRYIAELHDLDAFDTYGFLQRNPDTTLRGKCPSTSVDQLLVVSPTESWQAQVRSWTNNTLEGVENSRFADLLPEIAQVFGERIERLDGPFEPVLGHIDNSLENVRHDPETGEITAMLDWAFSLSVTPGYDLVLIEESLNGGQWRLLPDSPDNTEIIRSAILEGYCDVRSDTVLYELKKHRELYELLSLARSMNNLEMWLGFQDATSEQVEAAARTIREKARLHY